MSWRGLISNIGFAAVLSRPAPASSFSNWRSGPSSGAPAVLGMFISNTATAVLMAPVALAVAGELKASPYPFAMIVALAASTAFMTPVSSPVNTLVVTPGRYAFGDFVRLGVPLSIGVAVVSVLIVPLWLPF